MKTKQLDPRDGELATLRWFVKMLVAALTEQHDQVMTEEGIEIKDGVHFRQGVQILNACDVCSLISQANESLVGNATRVFVIEPADVKSIPEVVVDKGVTPNIELIEDELRLHFHEAGPSFGMVNPHDRQFSVVVTYAAARRMMLAAAGVTVCDEMEKNPS